MQVNWTTSVAAGAIEAARSVVAEGTHAGRPLVDRSLAAAMALPAQALSAAIAALGVSPEEFWSHLEALAALESSADLAASSSRLAAEALSRTGVSAADGAVDRVERALVDVAGAFIAAQPRVVEELPFRRRPLQEQWEARGPGLLAAVGRGVSADRLVAEATIVLLPPVLGGAGRAYPAYQLVTLEAVLVNPIAHLPEALRIAWLLALLGGEPAGAGRPRGSQNQRVPPAALAALVLAAAEEVELAEAHRAHFDLVATEWLGDAGIAEPLWRWWQDYALRRPGWPAGLKLLAEALGSEAVG
jgi:hypothetical protein